LFDQYRERHDDSGWKLLPQSSPEADAPSGGRPALLKRVVVSEDRSELGVFDRSSNRGPEQVAHLCDFVEDSALVGIHGV